MDCQKVAGDRSQLLEAHRHTMSTCYIESVRSPRHEVLHNINEPQAGSLAPLQQVADCAAAQAQAWTVPATRVHEY